ncbi:competence protein CoiA family protein [Photobacterium damselae]|uniref:competence protein CoiA family protein n=1 Tax=Photobacterium damselae TaxID=38293 RepID=UPI000D08247E|nr:competence protein CoiA family protein [Photobacterium damselae]PSB85499.1 hypothetical protein C5F62_04250 [Photobacterium damselae subsp. damselae]SUB91735.1 Competence protein [Photobacterium damselae]
MTNIHITRAINKHSKDIVCIEDVPSGLQDDIVCACCGVKLIANKGQIKRWHFSHYAGTDCEGAYETQLHLTAKEFFSRHEEIPHPVELGWIPTEECEIVKITPNSVRIETYEDNRVPDLIVDIGSERYWIEIANKHKCDASKIIESRNVGRNIIEIDVSHLSDLDTFDSTMGCLFKVLSLSPFNDLYESIAESAKRKHKMARESSQALRRAEKSLNVKKIKIEDKERKLLERELSYEKESEKRRLNIDKQHQIINELKKSIVELNKRKEFLEKENEVSKEKLRNEIIIIKQNAIDLMRKDLEEEKKRLCKEYIDNILVDNGVIYSEALEQLNQERANAECYLENKRLEYQKNLGEISTLNDKYNKLQLDVKESEALKDKVLEDTNALVIEKTKKTDQLNNILESLELLNEYGDKIEQIREYHKAKPEVRNIALQIKNEREHFKEEKRKIIDSISLEQNIILNKIEVEKSNLNDLIRAVNSYCIQLRSLPKEHINEILKLKLPDVITKRLTKHNAFWPRNAEHVITDMNNDDLY